MGNTQKKETAAGATVTLEQLDSRLRMLEEIEARRHYNPKDVPVCKGIDEYAVKVND